MKLSSPAPTKPTVITVVAEDDWITAVVTKPLATPLSGVVVNRASRRRRFAPAASRSASVIIFMPSRNNPIPPSADSVSDMAFHPSPSRMRPRDTEFKRWQERRAKLCFTRLIRLCLPCASSPPGRLMNAA